MRFRNVMNAEQKSIAWEISTEEYKLIQEGKPLNQEHNKGHRTSREHELSTIGLIFSPLRTANYISGFVTYEDSNWLANVNELSNFSSSIIQERVIPAFESIHDDYGFTFKCIFGCDEKYISKVYEFTNMRGEKIQNDNYIPHKFYASVCSFIQRPVHRLNASLFDPLLQKQAKYNNPNDGFNIHLMFSSEIKDDVDVKEQLEKLTKFNPNCFGPKGSIDAFNFTFGRDLYRSISKSIPEYYATLNFDTDFALYNGEIWQLKEKDDAKLFHGIKTLN